MDLNGDCYVDSEDLVVIAGEWLHTDCTAPGNYQSADFAPADGVVDFLDFADFGSQNQPFKRRYYAQKSFA